MDFVIAMGLKYRVRSISTFKLTIPPGFLLLMSVEFKCTLNTFLIDPNGIVPNTKSELSNMYRDRYHLS